MQCRSISEARTSALHTFRGAARAPPLLCIQRRWRIRSTNSAAGFPKSIAEEIREIHRDAAGGGPSAEQYRNVPVRNNMKMVALSSCERRWQ